LVCRGYLGKSTAAGAAELRLERRRPACIRMALTANGYLQIPTGTQASRLQRADWTTSVGTI
jgi:hypothetical protein